MTAGEWFFALVQAVLFVMAAPFFAAWIKRVKCWLQNRRPPPIHQSWLDLRRLFAKQVLLAHTASPVFRVTPYMVFGTPGGDRQDQWTIGFLLRHLHHGMNLQESIDCPMWQTDHFPSSFWPRNADLGSLTLEDRFPKATVEGLKERGHKVTLVDGWSLGRISAATKEGDLLKAAANPRFNQGYAIGR